MYLALTGHWVAALIMLLFGSIITSSLDNFLYPIFVGAQLHQHPVTIRASLLWGGWLFGIGCLVLGAVLFSIADSLLAVSRTQASE